MPFVWVSAVFAGVGMSVQGGKRRRAVPVGIMTDSAVAEADLMTLPPVRELRFSAVESPESCWCRARRSTKSLVALGADGSSSFGGCSSPAFDLLPIGEGRERDDDSSPTSQDHMPGTPAFKQGPQGTEAPPPELPTTALQEDIRCTAHNLPLSFIWSVGILSFRDNLPIRTFSIQSWNMGEQEHSVYPSGAQRSAPTAHFGHYSQEWCKKEQKNDYLALCMPKVLDTPDSAIVLI